MVFLAIFLVIVLIVLAQLYRRCPSNRVLVVYGRVGKGKAVQCYHGGGSLIWPLIQGYAFLDLTPRTIHIPLKGALSHQNIRVNVPSTFTIAIGLTADNMNNAAVRLLAMDYKEIESTTTEIITGQLRLTIASLRIEEINQDRERFLEAIKKNIETELDKLGLILLNVNITDITDESEYIESIGKKASATAVNQAKVDVAEQEKQGDVGRELAERDRRVSVASFHAEAVQGENDSKGQIAMANATLAEREAEASRRSQVAKEQAEAEIQKARAMTQAKRLEAELIVPQEVKKKTIEIESEAEALGKVLVARGEAEAVLTIKKAEAEGILKLLESKARGYQALIEACGNDAKSASTLLLIEKAEELVKLQAGAIKDLKIDKITVWDSGTPPPGSSSTAHFISQLPKVLPPLQDILSLAGLQLPEFLGQAKKNSIQVKKEESLEEEISAIR